MAKNFGWRGIFFAGVITALAGFVDGIGFIHFGGYFLSFMSGNSSRSSAALMTGDVSGWAVAMALVGSFVGGVVLATLLTALTPRYRRATAMYLSSVLIAVAAFLGAFSLPGTFDACLLAAAMGAVNVSYSRSGEVSLGLTYMTGTLVKLGQHLGGALLGLVTRSVSTSDPTAWLRYAALWAMITLGSLAGVFSYLHIGLSSLWIAAIGMAIWASVGLIGERRIAMEPSFQAVRRTV